MLHPINDRVALVVNETGFTYCNCLLVDDDIRLLVDSGAGAALDEIKPENIDLLINSHRHLDHIRGNHRFTAATILAHPLEARAMQSPENLLATNEWRELMGTSEPFDPAVVSRYLGLSTRVNREIEDGEVIDCGKTRVVVLHTPGHAQGHCSFFLPEENLVFLGDICLSRVGPWYGGPEADIDSFISSINRVLDLKPERLATGHVNHLITENIPQVLVEYRDRIFKREKLIYEHLRSQPLTIDELASQHFIYREHSTPFVLYWEKYMLKKHVERLIREQRAREVEPGYYQSLPGA